jgi:hypothetical protein
MADINIKNDCNLSILLNDDNYTAISKDNATKRVQKALDNYDNNKKLFLDEKESQERMNIYINSLKDRISRKVTKKVTIEVTKK